MRIVVSGSPGSGKTTLVKALAERFRLPIISENLMPIYLTKRSFTSLKSNGYASDFVLQDAFDKWTDSYLEWADERARLYAQFGKFVADRWEADMLSNWLSIFSSVQVDEKTSKLILDMQSKAKTLTFAVMLPPQTTLSEAKNEDGLNRQTSYTHRMMRDLLTDALIGRCEVPLLWLPREPFIVEERVRAVEAAIQKRFAA
jgi:hypothetical protein